MLAAPNLSPAAICAAVAELHLGSAPFVDGTFQGGECRIFKVRFSDTPTTVAVRVRHPEHGDRQDIAISQVGDEARMLQRLEALGFRWSPRCRAASLSFANPVGHPFLVLDWADGVPLAWDDASPSRPVRDAVLAQLAAIQLSLVTRTAEHRTSWNLGGS